MFKICLVKCVTSSCLRLRKVVSRWGNFYTMLERLFQWGTNSHTLPFETNSKSCLENKTNFISGFRL